MIIIDGEKLDGESSKSVDSHIYPGGDVSL